MSFNPGTNNGSIHGFGNVVHGTQCKPPGFVLGTRQRRHEDNRYIAGSAFCLECFTDAVTGHARHHNVEQNQVRLFTSGQFKCTLTVFGEQQAILVSQYISKHLKVCWFVVYQEKRFHISQHQQGSRVLRKLISMSAAFSGSKSSSIRSIALTQSTGSPGLSFSMSLSGISP